MLSVKPNEKQYCFIRHVATLAGWVGGVVSCPPSGATAAELGRDTACPQHLAPRAAGEPVSGPQVLLLAGGPPKVG